MKKTNEIMKKNNSFMFGDYYCTFVFFGMWLKNRHKQNFTRNGFAFCRLQNTVQMGNHQ